MYREKADEVFKYIPIRMEQFYDIFDKECMEIPIFRYYEPRNVLQRLMYSSNEDLVIIKDKMIKRAEVGGVLDGCKGSKRTNYIRMYRM